ncbi:MAG: ABC transporter ATP-binding protein, partial [Clostridiaceae bacterium]|nr:ABC transporter ATP-binding protein [Clostridiaceae bacterium]
VTITGGKDIDHPSMQLLGQDGAKRTYRFTSGSALLLKLIQDAGPDDFTVNNESLEERFMDLYGLEDQQ